MDSPLPSPPLSPAYTHSILSTPGASASLSASHRPSPSSTSSPRPPSPPLLPIPPQPASSSPTLAAHHSPSPTSQLAPPPSYASLTTPLLPSTPSNRRAASHPAHHAFEHDHSYLALPSGYFLLRNKAQGKTLDARGRGTHEGTEICAHPVKQPKLHGSSNSLINNQNNQVLFLDWDGHLLFANSSRQVDCVDGALSLAHPQPLRAIASRESHPAPRFSLDPHTGVLRVLFSADPAFPGPDGDEGWQEDEYIVEVVPRRKVATAPALVWAAASSGLAAAASAGTNLVSSSSGLLNGIGERFGGLFGGKVGVGREQGVEPPPLPSKVGVEEAGGSLSPPANAVASTSTSLAVGSPPLPPVPLTPSRLTHVSNEDDADGSSESDDEPDAYRPVQVVKLAHAWREKFPAEALANVPPTAARGIGISPAQERVLRQWRRRQWEVVPVVVRPLPPPPSEEVDAQIQASLPSMSRSLSNRDRDRDREPTRASVPSPLRLRSDADPLVENGARKAGGSPSAGAGGVGMRWSSSATNLAGAAAGAAGSLLSTSGNWGRGLVSPPLPQVPNDDDPSSTAHAEPEGADPRRWDPPSSLMARLGLGPRDADLLGAGDDWDEHTPPMTGVSWADAQSLPSEEIARWAMRRGSAATSGVASGVSSPADEWAPGMTRGGSGGLAVPMGRSASATGGGIEVRVGLGVGDGAVGKKSSLLSGVGSRGGGEESAVAETVAETEAETVAETEAEGGEGAAAKAADESKEVEQGEAQAL